jgi:hypothetical protein
MKNIIFAGILMIITTEAQSQILKNDPVNIPDGHKFKEIGSDEITDTININGGNLIFGFADINVSDLDRKAVKAIVDNAESVKQIINILGPISLMAEYEYDNPNQEDMTISGFYYSFRPHEYDPSYIYLTIVWPLKNRP